MAPWEHDPTHAPDALAQNAMNEINAARRLRVAALEKAEANKVTVVKSAEAEAESKFLQGQGLARQRQAIVAGLRDSVKDFGDQVCVGVCVCVCMRGYFCKCVSCILCGMACAMGGGWLAWLCPGLMRLVVPRWAYKG